MTDTLSVSDSVVSILGDPYGFRSPTGSDLFFDPTVGADGSGSDASPWNVLTLARMQSLSAGQALWFKNNGGSGTLIGFDMTGLAAGNSSSRITVACYPGHTPVQWTFSGRGKGLGASYWDIRGLDFRTDQTCINLGEGSWQDNTTTDTTADHVRFIDCIGTRSSSIYTDNSAIIGAGNGGDGTCEFIDFIRCHFTGPAGQTQNQSLIFLDYIQNFNIIGCLLEGASNPLYLKHTDFNYDVHQNGLLKNCIFRNAGRGVRLAMNYLPVQNCAFDAATMGMDENGGGLSLGGNNCLITHCTFLDSDWFMGADDSNTRFSTTARDNVMLGTSRWKDNPFGATDGGNVIDYTATDTASRYYRNSSVRTMASYKATYATQEVHGETGTISLVGGTTPGATAANWALSNGSIGIGDASDGGSRGVDATKLLTVN